MNIPLDKCLITTTTEILNLPHILTKTFGVYLFLFKHKMPFLVKKYSPIKFNEITNNILCDKYNYNVEQNYGKIIRFVSTVSDLSTKDDI